MFTVGAIILLGRIFGALLARVGQPRVIGEVIAGILLGPTLVGAMPDLLGFETELRHWPFSEDLEVALKGIADVGLAFYMFLVGIELDPTLLRGRLRQATVISLSSIVLPFALGIGAALFIIGQPALRDQLAGPAILTPGAPTAALAFMVFLGVSMSITAFPVLARILLERGLLRRPVGALALAAAAIDDIVAWSLLALAVALAPQLADAGGAAVAPRGPLDALSVVTLAGVFAAVMFLLARPLLNRLSDAYDEAGHIPAAWLITILVGVLVSAFAAQQVGVAAIFGAFVMGVIMPRRRELTLELSHRIEDFVVIVLLPVFFVIAGLNADIGALLRDPALWVVTAGLTAVAIVGKYVGATVAARASGSDWRTANTIGALMNTRGLTELIVLIVGLNAAVISQSLYSALVVMAVVTTVMTGPIVRFLQGRQAPLPPEAEAQAAEAQAAAPGRAVRPILVAAQDARNLDPLVSLAEPLARAGAGRPVIVAMVVPPPQVAAGLTAVNRDLLAATREVNQRRTALAESGVEARSLAFTSVRAGEDIVRLATEHDAELVLLDGRRSLLGDGLPAGAVARVLENAAADVAVLIERPTAPRIGPGAPVLVPFGGAEHDWAALEVAAGLATSSGAALRLVAVSTGEPEDERGPTRLLAAASLVVQKVLGIAAESVVVRDRAGLLEVAAEAGLLVIGLSERWRDEGLGRVRNAIAERAPVPILFVRRGQREGRLGPADDVTQFRWSVVGSGTVVAPPGTVPAAAGTFPPAGGSAPDAGSATRAGETSPRARAPGEAPPG
jgi:Kef-type K+ transport system membrane component KefB